jgi:hypothetical protein
VTGAEGDLSSLVGEGPSPTRRDEDRPAQGGTGGAQQEKPGFATNAGRRQEAAGFSAGRLSLLQAFIRAGQRLLMRMMGISSEAPAQDGAGGEQQDKPGFTPNAGRRQEAAAFGAGRLSLLQAFVKAGQRLVMRMMGLPEAPAPDRPSRGSGGSAARRTPPR